jgi:hypothetical protein
VLHEKFDTLSKLVREGAVWYDYKEPKKMPSFIPTYKKKPYRAAVTRYDDPDWVHEEYRYAPGVASSSRLALLH